MIYMIIAFDGFLAPITKTVLGSKLIFNIAPRERPWRISFPGSLSMSVDLIGEFSFGALSILPVVFSGLLRVISSISSLAVSLCALYFFQVFLSVFLGPLSKFLAAIIFSYMGLAFFGVSFYPISLSAIDQFTVFLSVPCYPFAHHLFIVFVIFSIGCSLPFYRPWVRSSLFICAILINFMNVRVFAVRLPLSCIIAILAELAPPARFLVFKRELIFWECLVTNRTCFHYFLREMLSTNTNSIIKPAFSQ